MIGAEFRQYLDVTFPQLDDETICVVAVRPSGEPAYLVHQGKEQFYICAGNATQSLSVSKATKYIQTRFDHSRCVFSLWRFGTLYCGPGS